MTLIEELLQLFEQAYDDGVDAAEKDHLSGSEAQGALTAEEAAQKALQGLRSELRAHLDLYNAPGETHFWTSAQVSRDLYFWVTGDTE